MVPFPKMKISKTSIHADMDWKSEPLRTSFENSRNGHVYFYRDKNVPPKTLTAEEVAALQLAETKQRSELHDGSGENTLAGAGSSDTGPSTYVAAAKSGRKERGLKIYLDSSPAKVTS